jgi:hypothetical protein
MKFNLIHYQNNPHESKNPKRQKSKSQKKRRAPGARDSFGILGFGVYGFTIGLIFDWFQAKALIGSWTPWLLPL